MQKHFPKNPSVKHRRGWGWASFALCLVVVAGLTTFALWSAAPSAQKRSNDQRFGFSGLVKSVDKANRRATIKHDKVGDFMEPMTMPFLIKDAKALNELRAGDQIKATLVVTDEGGQWLEQVTIQPRAQARLQADNATRDLADNFTRQEGGAQ